jgi:hypothetical protein
MAERAAELAGRIERDRFAIYVDDALPGVVTGPPYVFDTVAQTGAP